MILGYNPLTRSSGRTPSFCARIDEETESGRKKNMLAGRFDKVFQDWKEEIIEEGRKMRDLKLQRNRDLLC